MQIGIFASGGDRQARALEQALNTLEPGSALYCDLDLDPPERSGMGAGEITWNGVDLSRLDAAFLRGFAYRDPIIPSGNLDLDWSLWRADYIALQQKYTYLYSFFCELERRGVKLLNGPEAHLRVFMRPLILEELRRGGLNVPPLVCTNAMDAAREFCSGAGGTPAPQRKVLWRPATGRAAYQLFLDRQREALISPQKPPIILAEAMDGPLVRGFCFDGKPLLFLQRSAPKHTGEETLEGFWETDCAEARGEIARAAELLKIPWLEVSFVLNGGKAWIYDLDADPLFEALPPLHSEKLTTLLAAKLLKREPVLSAPSEEGQERPTIFLRRMLRILFEFEQSKYGK